MASMFRRMMSGSGAKSGAESGDVTRHPQVADSPFDSMREGEATLMAACERGESCDTHSLAHLTLQIQHFLALTCFCGERIVTCQEKSPAACSSCL